jgi:hydrogenase nickel incorporation protein HypB
MKERITVVEKIMGANERLAEDNRAILDQAGVVSLNLMASPGAGKTSLIEQTLARIGRQFRIAVVDGDVATNIDADRAAAAGATAVQINTGGDCHLDASMVQQAINQLDLSIIDLLIVENVGNLICPANFQLGTHYSVLIASVTEGDDKPYKYPGMYQGADILVINKIDLLPYVDFDLAYFKQGVEALNPSLLTFYISCKTGEGLEEWENWISGRLQLDYQTKSEITS